MDRVRTPELMDTPSLNADEHLHALLALNRVNRILGVDECLHACVRRVAGKGNLSILDLGAGGGGFLGYVAATRPSDARTLLIGLDRSTFALRQTRRQSGDGIRCVTADARSIPLADESVDLTTCSLLLHHFDAPGAVQVLREAARVSRKGVVVGDLSRSALAWVLTWVTTRMTSRSHVFHVDGPRSVRAAFRADELALLAQHAGLEDAQIERRFPFRLALMWRKAAS